MLMPEYNLNITKGLWFYGMSGAGKTTTSNYIVKKLKANKINYIHIDGELTREYINFDLGYQQKDREIIIKRNYGMAVIALESNCFPVVCSVFMNAEISDLLYKKNIMLVKLERDMNLLFKEHTTYKDNINIVGKDIIYTNVKQYLKIFNTGDKKYFVWLDNFYDNYFKLLIQK